MEEKQVNHIGYNPGYFKLCPKKLKSIMKRYDSKDAKLIKKSVKKIKKTLLAGDMNPGKVICLDPLLIAVYGADLDAVLILKFPSDLVEKYNLTVDKKIISCNSYWPKEVFDIEYDIIPGELANSSFRDIIPIIPLFTAVDKDMEFYFRIFTDELWNRFEMLTKEYLEKRPNQYRDGFKQLIY